MQGTASRQLELALDIDLREIWQSLDEPQRRELLDLLSKLLLHGLQQRATEETTPADVTRTPLILESGELP